MLFQQVLAQEGYPAGSCATTPATNAPTATMDVDFILKVRSDELMLVKLFRDGEADEGDVLRWMKKKRVEEED